MTGDLLLRPARLRLRLPLLRHPLVREFRLRGEGLGERGADPRAGADRGPGRDAAAAAHTKDARLLCSGPGRLTEALGITHAQNGLALDEAPFELRGRTGEPDIVTGPRIGITKAVELPWRYGMKGSTFLSRRLG